LWPERVRPVRLYRSPAQAPAVVAPMDPEGVVKQTTGDLWRLPADARCITTNGAVRKDGCAIMGRGVAAQAKERWPAVPKWLGDSITSLGNHVDDFFLRHNDPDMAPLVAFPVKHHWQQAADLDLILRSCRELMDLADERPWQR